MENFIYYLLFCSAFISVLLYVLIKKGVMVSSRNGLNISSNNLDIKLNGKVHSITLNNTLIHGDLSIQDHRGNTITQNNGNYSIQVKQGHVNIKGNVSSISINGKKLSLTQIV